MQMVGADRLALVVPAEAVRHFGEAVLAQHARLQSLQAHGMTPGQQMMAFGPQRQQQLPPPISQQVRLQHSVATTSPAVHGSTCQRPVLAVILQLALCITGDRSLHGVVTLN